MDELYRLSLALTTWLQENLDVLNEHLDIELQSAEREQAAGAFSVDLVAEDETGRTVIIENQLGKTDHDHLGKLLTYLAAFDAERAIWITSDPRPEHVKAIAWLNDSTPASFHLFKVEAVKIGDSPPAPLLTPIVGPSIEGKRVAQSKEQNSERHRERLQYWSQLLELARPRTMLHARVSPRRSPYIDAGSGISGVTYSYWVRQNDARVVLWIDRGKDKAEANRQIFEQLAAHKVSLESAVGPILWDEMAGKRSFKLVIDVPTAPGWRTPQDEREAGMVDLIEAMSRLEQALAPIIKQLDLSGMEPEE